MKDSSTILNRIKKNYKARKNLAKSSKTTAYRVYEKDIPEYPYIIDLFNDYAVVYEKGKKMLEENTEDLELRNLHQAHIILALQEILHISRDNIIFKRREKQKGKEQYNPLSEKNQFFTIQENDMKFLINVHDYLDPGLFLDHRPLRAILKKTSNNKKVLNLFAYTGSLSIAAALGGGTTTTIDMSNTYLTWAEDNFRENDIDLHKHHFIQADITRYLDSPLQESFDIIILDPPNFSNSKKMDGIFNVQENHPEMIHQLMKSLSPDGVLYFSNNFRKFKLASDISDQYRVKDISIQTIPKDFRDLKIHVCFEIRNN